MKLAESGSIGIPTFLIVCDLCSGRMAIRYSEPCKYVSKSGIVREPLTRLREGGSQSVHVPYFVGQRGLAVSRLWHMHMCHFTHHDIRRDIIAGKMRFTKKFQTTHTVASLPQSG